MRIKAALRAVLSHFGRSEQTPVRPVRGSRDHVIIIDGTMSSLDQGDETNAGLAYRLLAEAAPQSATSIRYEAGIQWDGWRNARDILEGRGTNRQIRRAYSFLASRYRPGDRIFLLGYSRGAYAVRSLAGVIDRVGLLKAEHATERNIQIAYRHYQRAICGTAQKAFTRRFCHDETPIEMIGVWDTVKALGTRVPFFCKHAEQAHSFHNHELGPAVRHGYHALALHETRNAYRPVLWSSRDDSPSHIEQVWFRGSHADVGGQLHGFLRARPLSNIPLVWMLEKAEAHDLALPENWRKRLPTNSTAPSVGHNRRWGRLFVMRSPRVVGRDPSESVHPSALGTLGPAKAAGTAPAAPFLAAMSRARRP